MAGEEDDHSSAAKEYFGTQIAIGFVTGIYDKGDLNGLPGAKHTLVLVTVGGANQSQLKTPKGRQLCCALSSLAGGRIPKDGTRVVVAIPIGLEESPGAPVIIATVEDDPDRLEVDRRVLDYTGEHVIIKAKSVVLQSDGGDFVSVGEPRSGGVAGITICVADGSAGAVWQSAVASMYTASGGDAKTLVQLTPTAAEFMQKDTGFLRLKGGELITNISGPTSMVCAKFFAGPNPLTAVPVVVGPTGIAAVASLTVSFNGVAP